MGYSDSYLVDFLLQSVTHSVIGLILVEAAMRIWKVDNPRERFRHRMIILVAPLLMFPAFQLFFPDRGSFYFTEDRALFDTSSWLGIRLAGLIPGWVFFALVLSATSLITFVQEILPILRDWRDQSPAPEHVDAPAELLSLVRELSHGMGMSTPEVRVVRDREHFLFVVGSRFPAIVISTELIETLDQRLLRNAIAHELAHIRRRSNAATLLAFLARAILIYNPVSLLVFRRLIQDDEKICDDLTVAATEDPAGLIAVLKVFQSDSERQGVRDLSSLNEFISQSSHNLLLDERIQRLVRDGCPDLRASWARPALTASAVAAICFYVV